MRPQASPGLAWRGRGGILATRIAPQALWLLLALVVLGAVAWPIAQLESAAFARGADAIRRMLALPGLGRTLRVTIGLAIASSLLALAFGTLLAFCAEMLPRPLRGIGQFLPLLPLLVPGAASVIGWIFLLSPKVGYLNTMLRTLPLLDQLQSGPFDIYSLPWIILITALLLASFVYLFVQAGLRNIGSEMQEAGAASGAGPWRRCLRITLPLLRPSLLMAGSVVFLLGMGQFTVPLLLGRTGGIDVLTTRMFFLVQQYPVDYGLGAALGLPILVVGLALVAVQKFGLGNQRRFVVVNARARPPASETSWLAAGVVWGYGLLTSLLPIAALAYVSVTPFWRGQMLVSHLTLRHWAEVLSDPLLVAAIRTSVLASLAGVVLVTVLGLACAWALLHRSGVWSPLRHMIDWAVALPMAVPATLLGFGMLFAYSFPPLQLYGTSAILVVTYVTMMLGHATRLQLTNLLGIGAEFEEAARTSGAGFVRSFVLVILPLVRKGIGATAMLTFVLMFHEFSASMMVRSVRTQVVGSVMYDVLTGGVYAQVAVLALIMVAVSAVGVAVAALVGGPGALKRL